MDWDWQFLTPSSTPTTTSFECNPVQTPGVNTHFQDAFSPYVAQNQHQQLQLQPNQHQHPQQYQNPHQHQHQHNPSIISTGSALDFGDNSFYTQENIIQSHAYPQNYVQHAQSLHQAYIAQGENHGLAPAAPIGKEYQQQIGQQQQQQQRQRQRQQLTVQPQQNGQQQPPPQQQQQQQYQRQQQHQDHIEVGGMSSEVQTYAPSAESYQMHTPPPTRGASTKRRSQRTDSTVFGSPSSMTVRRLQQGDQQPPPAMTNQQRYPSDVSAEKHVQADHRQPQFSFPPPSSAAQYFGQQPEQQPLAQPRQLSNATSTHAPTGLEDPFSTSWTQPSSSASSDHAFYPLVSETGPLLSHKSRAVPAESSNDRFYNASHYGTLMSPAKSTTSSAGVDPSLVYSSPTRPGTSDSTQSTTASRPSSSASVSRIPYQHSLKDPREELQNVRTGQFRPPPPPQSFPRPQVQAFQPRPELQRSNTISGMRSSPILTLSDSATTSSMTRSNSTASLHRRSSPLKRERGNRPLLSSISETQKPIMRTSVVLKVDANGRARTETQLIEASPAKSAQERYPTLWDDSDSDSEAPPSSRSSSQWPSRQSSLAQARGDERQAKVAKIDPPSEGLENLHLLRSNSSTSLKTPTKAAYVAAVQLRRQNSAKRAPRTSSVHSRRNTLSSLNSSFENLASSIELSTSDRSDVQSDAGSALRQMRASRAPAQVDAQVQLDPLPPASAQNSQPQMQAQVQPQPMIHPPQRKIHQKSQSLAAPPTNYNFGQQSMFPVDYAPMQMVAVPAPTHGATYMPAPVFRCLCSLPLDDGRGALQCGYCAMYSHATCMGIDPQRMPVTFVCNFCSNSVNSLVPNTTQSFSPWGIAGI